MESVSVVICSKDSERMLQEVLESCLRNNPLEIILVDEDSSDGTLNIAERFGIEVFTETKGLGYARHLGSTKARGEFVAYVDSDILLPPNTLTILVSELIENGYAGISARIRSVSTDTYWAWAENQEIELKFNREGETDHIGTPASIFRKEVLMTHKFDPFFVGAAEDKDLAYRLQKAGKKLGVSSAIAYHNPPTTLSHFMNQKYWYGKGDARFFWKHRDLKRFIFPFFAIPHAFLLSLKERSFKMFPYYAIRSISDMLGRIVELLRLSFAQSTRERQRLV